MWNALCLLFGGLTYSLQLAPGSFPRALTRQEEDDYLKKSHQGDLEARNKLIEHNLRLVAHITKKYYAQTADREDLISIGTIGLIKGITTFNPAKGARLATYAARCIENAILSPWNFGVRLLSTIYPQLCTVRPTEVFEGSQFGGASFLGNRGSKGEKVGW